jgi:hypothetical protein
MVVCYGETTAAYQGYTYFNYVFIIIIIAFGAFTKLRKALITFVMSVRLPVLLHGTTWFPLTGFSCR